MDKNELTYSIPKSVIRKIFISLGCKNGVDILDPKIQVHPYQQAGSPEESYYDMLNEAYIEMRQRTYQAVTVLQEQIGIKISAREYDRYRADEIMERTLGKENETS